MKIEVLYIPGCANYEPTLERVERVLASESVPDRVSAVPVSTEAEVQALLFPGSPTVRVNGRDVEPYRTNTPSLACRLYANGTGVPAEEMVRAAIIDAKEGVKRCE